MNRGFGGNLVGAIIGVPIGVLLIIVSCGILYWNEGRVDYSKVAKTSTPVSASQVSQSNNDKFVSVTGNVSTTDSIGDGAYLKDGSYVSLHREVEEYAWVQQSHTSNHTTTYSYNEDWTDTPADSSSFNQPSGHTNPPKALADTSTRAQSGSVGVYPFNPGTVSLPPLQPVSLSTSNTTVGTTTNTALASATPNPAAATATSPLSNLTLANSQYIYGGSGSLSSPVVGDIRISYQALPSGTQVTIFGLQQGGAIQAYTDPHNHTLYDVLLGDRQTAIATLHTQYEHAIWIWRGIGVGLIWLGLMMLLGPLDALLDFIPIVGQIGKAITLMVTLPIALVLGGTVIVIGYSLHHIVALIIAVPVVILVFVGLFKLIKKARGIGSRKTPPPTPQMPTGPAPQAPAAPLPPSGSLFPTQPTATPQPPVTPPQEPPQQPQ